MKKHVESFGLGVWESEKVIRKITSKSRILLVRKDRVSASNFPVNLKLIVSVRIRLKKAATEARSWTDWLWTAPAFFDALNLRKATSKQIYDKKVESYNDY